MRRIVCAALAAALVMPAAAHTASAEVTVRPAAAARAQTLAVQRTAAFRLAGRYAAQAPRISWRQKARNANTLAVRMRLPNIAVRERASAIGKTQLGTLYRYGGTTPAGFDCSGFTRYAYAKAGKKLPRTAAQQRRASKVISSPRAGDLVFLGGRNPYHVGIYVGNGKMLHSPRTGKPVQIAKIWSKPTYGRV